MLRRDYSQSGVCAEGEFVRSMGTMAWAGNTPLSAHWRSKIAFWNYSPQRTSQGSAKCRSSTDHWSPGWRLEQDLYERIAPEQTERGGDTSDRH
jgi:hypothetical protein